MIQIAGVKNQRDMEVLVRAGVDYIGFPLRLGYHEEDMPEDQVKKLIQDFQAQAEPVLITYLQEHSAILKLAQYIQARVVQLHADISRDELEQLKSKDSELKVIKSLVVRENNLAELLEQVQELSSLVDYFITDTFDPKTGAEGATGKTHDWSVSRELVLNSSKPVILAGGLKPSNIEEAIERVKPYGVDCHTGVENSEGFKDPSLVQDFIERARAALKKL